MTKNAPRSARSVLLRAAAALFFVMSAAAAHAADAAAPSAFQRHAALFLQKCAKCHTIGGGRRVGPDLRGVADRHEKEWILAFVMNPDAYLDSDPAAKKLLAENNGVRMENAHVTREQAEGLLEFISAATISPAGGANAPKPLAEAPLSSKLRLPDEGLYGTSLPGLLVMSFFLLVAVLLSRVGERRGAAVALVLVAAGAYWGFGGWRHHRLPGDQQGYQPVQPLPYSHAMHAGRLGIHCLYCHSGAERSDVAAVPALNVCMNCHGAVRKRADQTEPSPEIAKLVAAWETRNSSAPVVLAWTRVHRLPDYVHFSHRVHVANDIQCQECHGPVQTMDRVRQASSLSMGWCVSCHRQVPQNAPSHWKRVGGPQDCSACHW